jgi:putative FmdB family regulatory protein
MKLPRALHYVCTQVKGGRAMATYEYRCPACGSEFEIARPMSEAAQPAKCPKCGAEAQKLISGFASTFGYGIKGTSKPPLRR